ncbi:UNVERIFIED_CONTAM: hypothetical protein GTU68_007143 [Idotea baltica]|nr:hypothetical protein [Idotea baltica]
MPGPNSFTGEDIAELHLHGNPLICKQMLREIFSFGVKPAEPGEFSKRAFLNGKLDLVQAEAICDLISAKSENALEIAKDHLNGKLSGSINTIGEPLKNTLAEIEAHIDFPEEDINPDTLTQLKTRLKNILKEVHNLLSSYEYGILIKDGCRVLLAGVPNVGKSSLLNALLETDRAIVTDISGTTRDTIEEEVNIEGFKFIFCDSAGLTENAKDAVEKIGIEKTKSKFTWAHIILFITSPDTATTSKEQNYNESILAKIKTEKAEVITISNKSDISINNDCNLSLSIKNNSDIRKLKDLLIQKVSKLKNDDMGSNIIVQERHRACLEEARKALNIVIKGLDNNVDLEFISADLRSALNHLQEIVGITHIEDILGRIFSKFCIGK